MLITNAEIFEAPGTTLNDLRIENGHVADIGHLTLRPGEGVLDAAGGALLPGLHDHHIHLLSYAASLNSVRCGPPDVHSEQELVEAIRASPGRGWLRGYGYHESVAGEIDRGWLDRLLPDRPLRIQQRSGRLWILNSAALSLLAERQSEIGHCDLALPGDGRLYDQDAQLGALLGRELPPVEVASRQLAGFGVTGVTDMTPANDAESLALFARLRESGALCQTLYLAGSPALPYPHAAKGITTAATKIHLHDANLPEFASLCATISDSHAKHRPIAVHCVTEVELVFALAAIEEAGALDGDRIEHASVTPPHLLDTLARLGLTVVTQPNFVSERGDAYLQDIAAEEIPWLYRAQGFSARGVPLAGGTDAPFGSADPWIAVRAAVERRTASGRELGTAEALTPEAALKLFLGSPDIPAEPRRIAVGTAADLCLLGRPWQEAREILDSRLVRATFIAGRQTF